MTPYFRGQEPEDSTWKIVYMDMITMLMILFLSLWIIDRGNTDDRQKHGDVTLNKVEFEADDYFDPGKAALKSQARNKIEELFFKGKNTFPAPGADLENHGRRVFLIHGHTDDQGDKRENLELGFQRAMAVYDELAKNVPALANHVGICSYADNFPASRIRSVPDQPGLSREWKEKIREENSRKRKKNRRFEILGQMEELEESALEK